MHNTLIKGNCLEVMKSIPDNSIDMILCDLPYGTTSCKWDSIIPLIELWKQYERITKPKSAIILTASQPFTTALISSNIGIFKTEWIWEKNKSTNFLHAKHGPLKKHESVLVFGKATLMYNPQGLVRIDAVKKPSPAETSERRYIKQKNQKEYVREFTGYPTSVIKIPLDAGGFHPTQKPVALFEFLIKSYTNEGMIVLDNCSGSGTTAIACINTNRKYICIERDSKYFLESKDRIEKHWLKDIL